MGLPPFHAAVLVDDLDAARSFYGGLLGCQEGRATSSWVDFDFYGHQLVCHLDPTGSVGRDDRHISNPVNGANVPVPHFGVVLLMEEWEQLVERLRRHQTQFLIEPGLRFVGKSAEQSTFFISDPSGNVLEFKALSDPGKLFAN